MGPRKLMDNNFRDLLEINVTVKVVDRAELWKAAYRIITKTGLTEPDEIEDLIGSVDNPNLEACLESILADPMRMAGCEYQDVVISPINDAIAGNA